MKSIQFPKSIKTIVFILFLMLQGGVVAGQEEDLKLLDRWLEWSDGQTRLVRHLNKQAFDFLDARDAEIGRLKTKADWINRQKKVADVLMQIVGPFPEKTPLNAKVTGNVKKEGYRIEKIVFESMPGFYVTGALYIPEGVKGKKPAILFTSGHAMESFRYPAYQAVILNLVKKGFVVFGIDPIGQGERIQLYDAERNASVAGGMTQEHSYLGAQCTVAGASIARYFIWDGIRAVDYLLSRREVDPSRIGIAGQSGGGTQAAYIFAFDHRIKAGAPVNFITGFRRLLQSIGPQDAEQNLYHGLSNGITHADLLEVRAPNPVIIGAGTRDFFSIQGARESYEEVKKAYAAMGSESYVEMAEDDWGHGFTPKLAERVCAFFQKHLNLPGDPTQEQKAKSEPEDLRIMATGQVATSFDNAETVFSINKKETQKLVDRLAASRKNVDEHLKEVELNARRLSGYLTPRTGKSVFRGRYQRDGYSVEMYVLEGEGDCIIPLLLFVPDGISKLSSVVYLHPQGKMADAGIGGNIEQVVKKGYIVAAPDLSGIGETKGIDGAGVAMLIGRSVVGVQAGDVIRVVNFLKRHEKVDPDKIGAVAFDAMGPVLLHAAAFDKSIYAVSLIGAPLSYESMALNEIYNRDFFNHAVAGALTAYDLPDLMACLAPRKIALVDLKDQMKQTVSAMQIDKTRLFPLEVYSRRNVSENISIVHGPGNISRSIEWGMK